MTNEDARAGGVRRARYAEASRIEFLLQRDGAAATLIWVRRTLAIYRRSVLDHRHFAHTAEYRRQFVASCLEFRLAPRRARGRSANSPAPFSERSATTSRMEILEQRFSDDYDGNRSPPAA